MGFLELPPELISKILSFVPVIDYYSVKLAGSHYVADVIRETVPRLPRGEYLEAIQAEDALRRDAHDQSPRRALEVMIARGQSGLALHYKTKYQGAKRVSYGMAEYHVVVSESIVLRQRRSFRLALHWAAYYGSKAIVGSLIDQMHIRAGKFGQTALHFAAISGRLDVIDMLLQNGAYINAVDDRGETALSIMLEHDETDAAEVLTSRGAKASLSAVLHAGEEGWVRVYLDPRTTRDQFHRVASCYLPPKLVERTRALKLYEEYRYEGRKLTPESLSYMRKEIMRAAAVEGYPSIFFCMVEDGADIDAILDDKQSSALHIVAKNDNALMTQALLDRGADPTVTIRSYYGLVTPFQLAICECCENVMELYLKRRDSLHVRNSQGDTALHLAARQLYHASPLELLLRYSPDVTATNVDGDTPLHMAGKYTRKLENIEYLVKAGANIEARNNHGFTPLLSVCGRDDTGGDSPVVAEQIASCLVALGANVNVQDNNGTSALQYTMRFRYSGLGIVKLLVDHGADIHHRDAAGRTALHLALRARWTNAESAVYLIERGADVNARMEDGTTPLHDAVRWESARFDGNAESLGGGYVNDHRKKPLPCEVLLKHGADPDARDNNGFVPLHLSYDQFVWETLLSAGANADKRDPDGHTTLQRLLCDPDPELSYPGNRMYMCKILLRHKARGSHVRRVLRRALSRQSSLG